MAAGRDGGHRHEMQMDTISRSRRYNSVVVGYRLDIGHRIVGQMLALSAPTVWIRFLVLILIILHIISYKKQSKPERGK